MLVNSGAWRSNSRSPSVQDVIVPSFLSHRDFIGGFRKRKIERRRLVADEQKKLDQEARVADRAEVRHCANRIFIWQHDV